MACTVVVSAGLMLLLTGAGQATTLLPSQTEQGLYTAAICRDEQVLGLIKSYAEAAIANSRLIAEPGRVHLEAVLPAKNLVGCSVLISTANLDETVGYVIGPEGGTYKIVIGGDYSKLLPTSATLRP